MTITTVGYGDRYPVTLLGRLTGMFVMFAGIGIIGALASILASLLVSPSAPQEPARPEAPDAEGATSAAAAPSAVVAGPDMATTPDAAAGDAILEELSGLRAEIAALRASLGARES